MSSSKRYIAIVADEIGFKEFKRGIRKNWPEIYKPGNNHQFGFGAFEFIRMESADNNLITSFKWEGFYEIVDWVGVQISLLNCITKLTRMNVRSINSAELYAWIQDEYKPMF